MKFKSFQLLNYEMKFLYKTHRDLFFFGSLSMWIISPILANILHDGYKFLAIILVIPYLFYVSGMVIYDGIVFEKKFERQHQLKPYEQYPILIPIIKL